MQVKIDPSSGFCWGVVRTVEIAEETLSNQDGKNVYILGQIIHNPKETHRLEEKGLVTISHEDLNKIDVTNSKVLIRAHGEPPSTYEAAKAKGIDLIDATCPLVTALQKRVFKFHQEGYQIVIFGKRDHAEVIGLRGVCDDDCVVIKTIEEAINMVDLSRKTVLISQTTMDKPTFYQIKQTLEERVNEFIDGGDINDYLLTKDTLCRAVYGREDKLIDFAKSNDVMIFVAGKNSSNGKSLFSLCKNANTNSYFIEDISEIREEWFGQAVTVGITGATSTPNWYMEQVKSKIEEFRN
jgi:4-hydroxy-3-methylbut-2-enyl diphosphate reductase